jgi:peptidoglycan hydrolase CwlO-like protein|tara:strand:+ start:386 stop:715 length:330 start_codon:yes stop_codon:yes gene_type:complete
MSERDLIQELKSTIKDLSDEKDELLKTIKQKESRIKTVMIKLEHATEDVSSIGHKIVEKDKQITKLKEKLKDKNKIVKKEIDEEIEKYITTNGTVEEEDVNEKNKTDEE